MSKKDKKCSRCNGKGWHYVNSYEFDIEECQECFGTGIEEDLTGER